MNTLRRPFAKFPHRMLIDRMNDRLITCLSGLQPHPLWHVVKMIVHLAFIQKYAGVSSPPLGHAH